MVLAGLLGWCGIPGAAPPLQLPPQEPTHVLLRTDVLLPPLVLPDTPADQVITALTVQVTFDDADEGRGLLTCEVGTPTVNTFGDVLQESPPVLAAHDITVRPLVDDPDRHRRLYTLTLTDGRFPNRLMLVRGFSPREGSRLLIRRQGAPPVRLEHEPYSHVVLDRGDIEQVLTLHDPTTTAVPQDATPQSPTLSWETRRWDGQQRLTVCGTLGGPALLHHDPNSFFFNAFGDVWGMSAVGSEPYPATLQPLPDLDPMGQGRRLFEVVRIPPKLKAGASRAERDRYRFFRAHYEEHSKNVRYILVITPTTAGPHRLLIWEHRRVQQLRHHPQHSGIGFTFNPTDRIEFYEEFLIPPPCQTAPAGQH